jgi:hypothetical protein
MSTSEDIHRLESELETHKRDLRDDAVRVNDKIEEAKAQLNPARYVRQRPGLALGLALLLGVAVELLLDARWSVEPRQTFDKAGKPLARVMLTNAGRRTAERAVG